MRQIWIPLRIHQQQPGTEASAKVSDSRVRRTKVAQSLIDRVFPLESSAIPPITQPIVAGPSVQIPNYPSSSSNNPAHTTFMSSHIVGVDDNAPIPTDIQEALDDENAEESEGSSPSQHQRRGPTFTFLNRNQDASRAPTRSHSPALNGTQPPPSEQGGHDTGRGTHRRGTYSIRDMLRPIGPISKDYLPEPQLPTNQSGGNASDDDPVSLGYVSERIARLLFE